jgi:type I restriction enzyme, R subunit
MRRVERTRGTRAAFGVDREIARVEHDAALKGVMGDLVFDHSELFKLFQDDPSFTKWLSDAIFRATYQPTPE